MQHKPNKSSKYLKLQASENNWKRPLLQSEISGFEDPREQLLRHQDY